MPRAAYALMLAGGLWLMLWRTRFRWAGLAPLAIGAGWTLATPAPDLLVTGDGQHLAVRASDGSVALQHHVIRKKPRDRYMVCGVVGCKRHEENDSDHL